MAHTVLATRLQHETSINVYRYLCESKPGHVCWHILTLLHRDGVTHRLRYLQRSLMDGGGRGGANDGGMVGGSVEDTSLSLGLSLAQVVGSWAHSSVSRAMVRSVNWSVLSHSDGCRGGNISGHHLGVMTHHVSGVDGLGGGLLTGRGDDLLAVLGDGGVHHLIILLVTNLPGSLHLAGHTPELGH